jgi:heme oxygenase
MGRPNVKGENAAHLPKLVLQSTFNGALPDDRYLRKEPVVGDYSKYQQKVIKNYYENKEAISLQRLSEHVTELYLAEGKARAKRWKDIVKVLENLKVPASRIDNLLKKDDPAMLAKLLEELLAKQK